VVAKKREIEKVGILYSSGKDSHLSTLLSLNFKEEINARVLLSILPENLDSYMFHKQKENILNIHSNILDIPIIIEKSEGVKEEELEDLKKLIKKAKIKYGINAIVSGAIESTYQSSRINKIAKDLKLKVYSPLWLGGNRIIKEYKFFGINSIFYKVSAYPLEKRLVGKKYLESLNFLKRNRINVFGEGGEFETLVLGSSYTKGNIEIKKYKVRKCGDYCYFMVCYCHQ